MLRTWAALYAEGDPEYASLVGRLGACLNPCLRGASWTKYSIAAFRHPPSSNMGEEGMAANNPEDAAKQPSAVSSGDTAAQSGASMGVSTWIVGRSSTESCW